MSEEGMTTAQPRLLIAANSFEAVGGVETSVLPWLDEALERGCEIEFVLCRVHGERADLIEEKEIPVFFHRLYWHVRGIQIPNPLGIWNLSRRVRRGGYDSIVCLQPPSHYFVRLAILISGSRPRVVAMEQLSYRDRRACYVGLDRTLSGITDLFLCVSESLRREFLERSQLPSAKALAIPHGISIPGGKGDPDPELAKALKGRFVVGCVARLAEEKRQRFLVECFVRFARSRGDRPVLLLVGDDREDPDLVTEIARRGLAEDVFVLGHRDDILGIYALLDLIVLPSVVEGFGLTWAEAMAHGIPVVTTRIAPMTEFIREGETGLFFEPDDEGSLEACLERLARDPSKRESLGKCGREFVKRELDPIRQRRKYVNAFLGKSEEGSENLPLENETGATK